MPQHCDGCGTKLTVEHALSCRVRGLVHTLHNNVADEFCALFTLAFSSGRVQCTPRRLRTEAEVEDVVRAPSIKPIIQPTHQPKHPIIHTSNLRCSRHSNISSRTVQMQCHQRLLINTAMPADKYFGNAVETASLPSASKTLKLDPITTKTQNRCLCRRRRHQSISTDATS